MAKRFVMLVMTNANENNNKFYELTMGDDESVTTRYGRVGNTGVTENKGYGDAIFDKVMNAKIKKGYRQVDIAVSENNTVRSNTSSNVAEIAKRDIINNDPVLEKLIEKLASINRFQLLDASGGKIDIIDGQVKTALGLITLDSVTRAKSKLNDLAGLVNASDIGNEYISLLEDYLTIVPQKIPLSRGWHNGFFPTVTTFEDQHALLEQIELSIKNYQPAAQPQEETAVVERMFGYSLRLVEDESIIERINRFYTGSVNRIHASSVYKLKRVYELINPDKARLFDEYSNKLGNVKKLWHGTRSVNLLSILKGGLIIPPTNGSNYTISGRMFGNGVYFSDQSSKSLNYATPYWSGGSNDLSELFMLKASVAMGNEYIPSGSTQHLPSGYDSIFAKSGKSGVMNNEMIVPNVNQFRLDYLCEFDK